jgi:TfoX/Sxy family transcriptional regulator of competence genes
MTKVITNKGKTIDVNARGDIIGAGGQVVKRREEVAKEYHATNSKAVQKISLKEIEPDLFISPQEAVKQATEAAAVSRRQQAEARAKKVIKDTDE